MKKILKKIINLLSILLAKKNSKKIIKRIKKYKYISFDVFDTLIIRKTKSEKDIFKIVEKKYNEKNKKKINDFYKKRIKCETIARKNTPKEEINIDDVYAYLNYDNSTKKALKELEKQIEIENTRKSNMMYKVYDYCIKNKKSIFITSDMYLKKETIKQILNNNGYDKIKKLYVSSEYNATKKNRNIFKIILLENNISKKDIIHIGDNFISDYINPKIIKVDSVWIKNKKE